MHYPKWSSMVLGLVLLMLQTSLLWGEGDSFRKDFKDVQPTRCDNVYLRRTNLFRQWNKKVKPGGIVLLGDSITQAFPEQKCPKKWNLNARGIAGDGVGGGTFRGLVNRLHVSCHALKPSIVFIKIGINDIIQWNPTPPQLPEELRLATLKEIVNQINTHNPKVTIYLTSVLPTRKRDNERGKKLKFESYNSQIIEFNKKIRALATETQCEYFDLHSKFYDQKDKQLKATYSRDGVHLNQAGYDLWISELRHLLVKSNPQ